MASEEYEDDFENCYEEDFEVRFICVAPKSQQVWPPKLAAALLLQSDGELEVPAVQQQATESDGPTGQHLDAHVWPSLSTSLHNSPPSKSRGHGADAALFGRSLFAVADGEGRSSAAACWSVELQHLNLHLPTLQPSPLCVALHAYSFRIAEVP